MSEKKKPGRKPEIFKIDAAFEDAVGAALTTTPITNKEREKQLSTAYGALHAALSNALYDEDPLGAQTSLGAPEDEYDHEAAKLAARLRQTDGDVDRALSGLFEDQAVITSRLVKRTQAAWNSFRRATR